VHRHCAKTDTKLSTEGHPCRGVEWNVERRRDLAIPFDEFPKWASQVEALRKTSPLRAAFNMLTVLTGCRPGELAAARWDYLDVEKRALIFPTSKTKTPITVPLSVEICRELRRARDAGRLLCKGATPWVFPAPRAASGHVERWSEPTLDYDGNSGRHTYRTVCAALGIDELTARLLLGHALSGISQGYITRSVLAGTSLRDAQRRVSRKVASLCAGRA
jgi:integrase